MEFVPEDSRKPEKLQFKGLVVHVTSFSNNVHPPGHDTEMSNVLVKGLPYHTQCTIAKIIRMNYVKNRPCPNSKDRLVQLNYRI